MNQNEEIPESLGGLGDLLPADVLKKLNELLADSSCQNETSLSPVRGKGMVYRGEDYPNQILEKVCLPVPS